jgi:hypothetical protein
MAMMMSLTLSITSRMLLSKAVVALRVFALPLLYTYWMSVRQLALSGWLKQVRMVDVGGTYTQRTEGCPWALVWESAVAGLGGEIIGSISPPLGWCDTSWCLTHSNPQPLSVSALVSGRTPGTCTLVNLLVLPTLLQVVMASCHGKNQTHSCRDSISLLD